MLSSLSVQEISHRIDVLSKVGHDRMTKAVKDAHFLAGAVCELHYLDADEKAEMHALKLELMSRGNEIRGAARDRILARRAARKANR